MTGEWSMVCLVLLSGLPLCDRFGSSWAVGSWRFWRREAAELLDLSYVEGRIPDGSRVAVGARLRLRWGRVSQGFPLAAFSGLG